LGKVAKESGWKNPLFRKKKIAAGVGEGDIRPQKKGRRKDLLILVKGESRF